MICMENLSFSYGEKKVLENFHLRLETGGRICLFGPSGVGKTTLLRILMGLEKGFTGRVDTQDAVVSAVFQEDRLLPYYTVLENLLLFSGKAAALECLDALGLSEAAQLYPGELSGGMARRAAIARALAKNADLYLLDEPFSGLDEGNLFNAARFINEKTQGKTLILVSHSLEEARLLQAEVLSLSSQNGSIPGTI